MKWLYQSAHWHLLYADGVSVLFIKANGQAIEQLDLNNPRIIDSIQANLQKKWTHSPLILQESLLYFHAFLEGLDVRSIR